MHEGRGNGVDLGAAQALDGLNFLAAAFHGQRRGGVAGLPSIQTVLAPARGVDAHRLGAGQVER